MEEQGSILGVCRDIVAENKRRSLIVMLRADNLNGEQEKESDVGVGHPMFPSIY